MDSRRIRARVLPLTAGAAALVLLCALTLLRSAGAAGPSGYAVAPNGSDSNPCTTASPCHSFDRAYDVVPAGAVVNVAAGSYGDQRVTGRRQSAHRIVFRAARGAVVSVGELRAENGAGGFDVTNMTLTDAYLGAGSHDITFRGDTMRLFYLRSTEHVSFLGGQVGGVFLNDATPTIGSAGSSPARNTLIDGVLFHDLRIDPNAVPAQHGECLFVQEADGLTIKNSTFRDCSTFDIYFHEIRGGGNPRNVVLENNFFGATTEGGFYALFFRNDRGESVTNVRLAFNSAAQGFHFDDQGTISNVSVIGNVYGPSKQCTHGVEYAYNVIEGIACGSTDVNARTGFVDPSTGDHGPSQPATGGNDLHLRRGARALGFVHSKSIRPRYDIDHDVRPLTRAADAGADQRETAAILLGRSIGVARIGATKGQLQVFYGRPSRVRSTSRGLTVATYRLHGGLLWVTYAADTAVGIGTSSSYYGTIGGLAAGSKIGTVQAAGLRRGGCSKSYRRAVGDVVVSVATRGPRISSIAMTRRAYMHC